MGVVLLICSTTVVDNFRELGNAYGNDDSELKLDGLCARKTNGRSILKTRSGGRVTSKPIASIRQD